MVGEGKVSRSGFYGQNGKRRGENMENEVNKVPISNEEAFVKACWAFKRRHRVEEPTAHEFGIDYRLSEILARHVHIQFEAQVIGPMLKKRKEAA